MLDKLLGGSINTYKSKCSQINCIQHIQCIHSDQRLIYAYYNKGSL